MSPMDREDPGEPGSRGLRIILGFLTIIGGLIAAIIMAPHGPVFLPFAILFVALVIAFFVFPREFVDAIFDSGHI